MAIRKRLVGGALLRRWDARMRLVICRRRVAGAAIRR